MDKRGQQNHGFPAKMFSHFTEIFHTTTLLCYGFFQPTKNFMPMRKISRLSMGKLLFDSTEKLIRRTLWCATNFGYRKIFCSRRIGHDSPSKIFCLAVPEYFVEEPFCTSDFFRITRILILHWGLHDVLSKNCRLRIPKDFVGKPFCAVV